MKAQKQNWLSRLFGREQSREVAPAANLAQPSEPSRVKAIPRIGQAKKGQTITLACNIAKGQIDITGWKYGLETLPGGRIILAPCDALQESVSSLPLKRSPIHLTVVLQDDIYIFGDTCSVCLAHSTLGRQCCIHVWCEEDRNTNLAMSVKVL